MKMPTTVILMVPLTLPLDLVNDIERESIRCGGGIPEMLSTMLIDAYDLQKHTDHEQAALENLSIIPGDLTIPPNGDGK